MKIEKVLEKIETKKWYSMDEIKKLGLFLDSKGNPSVFIVYRLIRKGRLKAQDVGVLNQPRYLVQGSELKRELKVRYKQFIAK